MAANQNVYQAKEIKISRTTQLICRDRIACNVCVYVRPAFSVYYNANIYAESCKHAVMHINVSLGVRTYALKLFQVSGKKC